MIRILLMMIVGQIVVGVSNVYAGAALVQVQQAKMRKAQAEAQAQYQAQQQYQAMQQQAVQEYAAQEQAQAYMMQQQIIQAQIQQQIYQYIQQQQVEQVEQALVMRYVQQALAQQMQAAQVQQYQDLQQGMVQQAIAQAVQRASYERALAERDANYAKAYLQARNEAIAMYQQQAVAAAAVQAKGVQQAVTTKYQQEMAQQLGAAALTAGMNRPFENVSDDTIRQVVGINELWKKLDEKAAAWTLIIDRYAKVLTIKEYTERFRQEGIKISQPPDYYARMIDDMAQANPSMLNRPFKELMQILAIMEYDFDNGMDRDTLARQALGEEFYRTNKKRLGR